MDWSLSDEEQEYQLNGFPRHLEICGRGAADADADDGVSELEQIASRIPLPPESPTSPLSLSLSPASPLTRKYCAHRIPAPRSEYAPKNCANSLSLSRARSFFPRPETTHVGLCPAAAARITHSPSCLDPDRIVLMKTHLAL